MRSLIKSRIMKKFSQNKMMGWRDDGSVAELEPEPETEP
jgi:hypothetical protein